MRPLYETVSDIQKELAIFRVLERTWKGFKIRKARDLAHIDGYIYDANNQLRGILEVKVRATTIKEFPCYLISEQKIKNMLALSYTLRVPAILCVQFNDCLAHTRVRQGYHFAEGGRKDRNDPKDMEICAFVPIEEFRVIS